jgi:hypothetical protein
MLVMVVVAVATVMGFAMVSASALQSQTTSNLRYVSTAEYLADSGAQLALHYLQYPSSSPVPMPNGYYPGQTGVTFGSGVAGTADITVTYDASGDLYAITSVGKATTPGGTTINKTVTATAAVVRQFSQNEAVTASSSIRLTSQTFVIDGLATNGQLTTISGSSVTSTSGTTFARYRSLLYQGGTLPSYIRKPLTGSDTVTVPSLATIKDYTGTYTYQGHTYTAKKLTSSKLSNVTLPTASDAVTNPAGIYWCDKSVVLDKNTTINGTIVITNGTLYVNDKPVTITPKTGFPAVVVQSDLALLPGSQLTANGLVWTGGGIKLPDPSSDPNADSGLLSFLGNLISDLLGGLLGGSGSNSPSTLAINGAYLAAGTTPIDYNYKGPITIRFVPTKCDIPDFSTTNTKIVGVRVVSWSAS